MIKALQCATLKNSGTITLTAVNVNHALLAPSPQILPLQAKH